MRRMCSWCNEILESGNSSPLQTTHGVCAPCVQKLLVSIEGFCGEASSRSGAESEVNSKPCEADPQVESRGLHTR
jgi:hypothetical protein